MPDCRDAVNFKPSVTVAMVIRMICPVYFVFHTSTRMFASVDGQGAELLEYRWLRLEDGTSDQPIVVKLFSTSQPETHRKLHPRETRIHKHPLCVDVGAQKQSFHITTATHNPFQC